MVVEPGSRAAAAAGGGGVNWSVVVVRRLMMLTAAGRLENWHVGSLSTALPASPSPSRPAAAAGPWQKPASHWRLLARCPTVVSVCQQRRRWRIRCALMTSSRLVAARYRSVSLPSGFVIDEFLADRCWTASLTAYIAQDISAPTTPA